jgi:hypothetical protein
MSRRLLDLNRSGSCLENTQPIYHLYTDNQAAEHIATQPNHSEHSRSIEIRHHEIKQDYVEGGMRIGGVSSQNNTADILTKILQPPLHAKHCAPLHILQTTTNIVHTNNAIFITPRTHMQKRPKTHIPWRNAPDRHTTGQHAHMGSRGNHAKDSSLPDKKSISAPLTQRKQRKRWVNRQQLRWSRAKRNTTYYPQIRLIRLSTRARK